MNSSSNGCAGMTRVFRRSETGFTVHVCVEQVESIFASDCQAIRVTVTVPAQLSVEAGTAMILHADWQASNDFDEGVAILGRARIDVAKGFQGLGIGSLAASFAVGWLKSLPAVPLSPIILDAMDATPDNAARRTRFYERFGITFAWEEVGVAAQAHPMLTGNLMVPDDDSWVDMGSPDDTLQSLDKV